MLKIFLTNEVTKFTPSSNVGIVIHAYKVYMLIKATLYNY